MRPTPSWEEVISNCDDDSLPLLVVEDIAGRGGLSSRSSIFCSFITFRSFAGFNGFIIKSTAPFSMQAVFSKGSSRPESM